MTICSDETYTWDADGVEYLGTDGDTTVHYEGLNCAPDTVLNVTVTPEPDPIVTNVTICSDETYTWSIDSVEYLGTDGDTTVHYEGDNCAADTVLNVTIHQNSENTIDRTVCDQLTINGETFTSSGTYTQYLTNVAGCDSVLTINLTVNESTEQTLNETACDSYELNGTVYNESGQYTQVLTTDNGCDLTITLNLTILESTEETIDVSDCNSVTINDEEYTESGTYTQNLINAAGCDSTLTVNVTILEPTTETFSVEDCEEVIVNDSVYTESGTYNQYLTNTAGCDSTLTVNVTILEPTAETIEVEGCGSVIVNDSVYTVSGAYTQILTNTAGCDSTLTIVATVFESTEETIQVQGCDSVVINETVYYSSDSYTQNLTNAAGCDSTLTVIATVLRSTEESILASACEAFTINDETFTETGVYVQHLTNAAGCDSTLTIELTIGDTIAPVTVCSDLTVELDSFGSASISLEDIENGSIDNCSIDTMFIDQTYFTCADTGSNSVILTVIDAAGNESTCTATVTVEQGKANCNKEVRKLPIPEPDILTVVECPGNQVIWVPNLLANDDLNGIENFKITVDSMPQDITLDLLTGDLNFYTGEIENIHIQFNYTICDSLNPDNCATSYVSITVLLDTDCDGVPNDDDIDDDDDGILDIHEVDLTKSTSEDADIDTDGDGIVDRLDLDSDGDGIMDNVEWQQTVAEGLGHVNDLGFEYWEPIGTDSDGDGWDDRYDDYGDNVYYFPLWDQDEDGISDQLDLDTDGDDIPDLIEGNDADFDGAADVSPSGQDSDKDGLDDAFDTYDTWFVKKDKYKNTISSNVALQDEDLNGKRDWRQEQDTIIPPPPPPPASIIFVPNGFSPNEDNYNDYFQIVMTDSLRTVILDNFGETFPDAKIEIYNRWGNLLYEKDNYGNYDEWAELEAWWDGTSMNDMQLGKEKLPTGTYFYILYVNDSNGTVLTGSVFLNN